MITVSMDEKTLRMEGHAGYAAKGEDIVCAAVSAIWYMVTEKLKKDGYVSDMHEESGCCELRLKKTDIVTRTVFDTAFCGFRLLAENYPQNFYLKSSGGWTIF